MRVEAEGEEAGEAEEAGNPVIDDRFLAGKPSPAVQKFWEGFRKLSKPKAEDELLAKMRKEDYWFAREVLGNQEVFPAVLEGSFRDLFEFTFSMGRTRRFGVINSPRGSYKTTVIACKVLSLIRDDRNVRILYFTNSYQNASLFSQAVGSHLESNDQLIVACGKFKPEQYRQNKFSAWRDDLFFVSGRTTHAKEATFTAAGIGVSKVGWHGDFIFVDDAVDKENSKTRESILGTIEFFKMLKPLLDKRSKYGPGGCILDSGTRYWYADLHGWLLGEGDDDARPQDLYESLVLQAVTNIQVDPNTQKILNPPEDFNFPFVLDRAELETNLKSLGSYWFYGQYQNEIRDPSTALFLKDQFQLVPHYEVPYNLRYHVLTDYASGLRERNDRTALWVVGLDWERKAFCVDFAVGRWPLQERLDRTMGFVRKYDADTITIEDVQANEGVMEGLRRERDRYRMSVRIAKISGRSAESKFLRVQSLQPRFEAKRIFFVLRDTTDRWGIEPKYIRLVNEMAQGEIVDEMTRFPKSPRDDIPDALSDLDKLEKRSGAYILGGAPRYGHAGMPGYRSGMNIINGRIQTAPLRQEPPERGFYGEAAGRIRGRERYGRIGDY